MCGISACYDLHRRCQQVDTRNNEKTRKDLYSRLDKSVELMRYRGPDGKGVWIAPDTRVGLAHVRLATRDLTSAGNQPMHSCDATHDIHIVVNGEIYYDDVFLANLRQEYDFQSASDSEIAIALYRRYGTSFVSHLRGEFALVLYDGKTRTLIAARDRFGVKPLHYGVFKDQLLIALQCKGIASLLKDTKSLLEWDLHCISQGCGHYGNRTLFQGIRKIPPGHVLIACRDRFESTEIKIKPYYRSSYPVNAEGVDNRTPEEMIVDLRKRLYEAVRLRLESSDVPVSILLSGGVDSGAVAGIAAHLAKKRQEADGEAAPALPTCFTIRFPDEGALDESLKACKTAEDLGLPIEVFTVDEQMLADNFEESCWLGEVPLWDLQHVAKKALCRYISERGFKVVLSGGGSDEFFGGYSFFAADRFCPRFSPGMSSRTATSGHFPAQDVSWYGLKESVAQDLGSARALGLPPAFCKVGVSRHDDWLAEEVHNISDPYQAIYDSFSTEDLSKMADYHPMHRAMLAWEKTFLPNAVIAAVADGAEMAHGIESRPPFLDHTVAQLSHTLPVDMLVHVNKSGLPTEKWILREAVRPYIPEEVYRRRKHPFAAPFRWQKDGPLHQKLSSVITRANSDSLGFVDWSKCEGMLDEAFTQGDGRLFRQAIWLAQLILIGQYFKIHVSSVTNITGPDDRVI